MQHDDPYQAPSSGLTQAEPFTSGRGVPLGVLEELRGTKPWARLISVLLFLFCGLSLLGALAMVAMSAMGGAPLLFALLYAVIGVVQLVPAVHLFRYAGAIARLLESRGDEDLLHALSLQRRFWRFVGILALAMLALYLAVFAGMVVAGAFSAGAAG